MGTLRLSDIAGRLGLTLQGEDAEVIGVNTLENASPDEISFLANPRYTDQLATTKACAVIVSEEHAGHVRRALVSQTPYQDFGRVLELFARPQGSFSGISPLAFIHPEAQLDNDVTIYPFAYIGPRSRIGSNTSIFPGVYIGEDCRIGQHSILYPNVVLMAGTHIGDRCILHSGCVLGADGFGFARTPQGIQKIPQVGRVSVENDVEIGANSAIDRAVLDATHIHAGTKIDNLVQIGHNVQIGQNCFIVSQVGISGSTHVGANCTFAGQVGIAGHLHIGDNVTIGPKSGVAKNIPSDVVVGGIPTVDQRTYMRTLALMPQFPDLFKRISKLEKELEKIQKGSKEDKD